jgi:hypothetical protein
MKIIHRYDVDQIKTDSTERASLPLDKYAGVPFLETDTGNFYIHNGLAWTGPYTAADVGLGPDGGGLASNGDVRGAGAHTLTINGYRVLVAGSTDWTLTFSGGGVETIPAAAMTVGQVYPEALTAITIGTGGSALLYIP